MRAIAKAQRLTSTVQRARDNAGLPPTTIPPEKITLQQVEAHSDSLHVTPESLLVPERAA
jgi:hypothetical protein